MAVDGLRYWRTQFEKPRTRGARKEPVVFAPARVVDDGAPLSSAGLEIRLATGDVIRADPGIPIERLRAVIQLLRERC
jgi:hypothetical protein